MAKNKRPKKLRTEFRKNRQQRTRRHDLTDQYRQQQAGPLDEEARAERVSGKGSLSRKRTVRGVQQEDPSSGLSVVREVDVDQCLPGVVLRSAGLYSSVQAPDGQLYRCATRRLLKTLATDQRHVVAAGDRVLFRPSGADEGIIERVEPRSGVLSRQVRGRQQVIVTNVQQLLIVGSAAEPVLKPHLIDRLLVTAEKAGVEPFVCINKIDLIQPADLMPLAGTYGQMGYRLLFTSATNALGIGQLHQVLAGRQTAVVGQSGVGKSSLLNAVQPELGLRVAQVSRETEKGKHTTTNAELIPLGEGGFVVDTPGVRQFALWDVIPAEVGGYFRDLRPFINRCQFPDCTHTHEAHCAVKEAVADGLLDVRRYESYCHMLEDEAG